MNFDYSVNYWDVTSFDFENNDFTGRCFVGAELLSGQLEPTKQALGLCTEPVCLWPLNVGVAPQATLGLAHSIDTKSYLFFI